jgi:hypothetical protein
MYKRIVVGLIVAFVVAAAMPLVAQAQERPPVNIISVQNCKYVGPAEPLSLNTVQINGFNAVKTIKAQKEIFYCYKPGVTPPDDKTLQDPLGNRDKITKGLINIVEIEIFAVIIEDFSDGLPPILTKYFQATRCVKRMVTAGFGTTLDTWVVDTCEIYGPDQIIPWDSAGMGFGAFGYFGPVPDIPSTAARGCTLEWVKNGQKKTSKAPYIGGPIPVEDPVEMNTVSLALAEDQAIVKTVKVNKEVFRCFFSGEPTSPTIYDIELFTEEIEVFGPPPGRPPLFNNYPPDEIWKTFEVAYCAKKEQEALILGCSWKSVGNVPFAEAQGAMAALRPFVTLKGVELKQSGGQYRFEAQGYNIEGVQVQVYNLAGKQVFSAESAGNSLSWNGLSSDGRRLANGVYLYVLTVKGTYGDIVQTKVQKLAILR